MTEQTPDELINESPFVDFGGLVPVAVVRGDISMGGEKYEFVAKPKFRDDAVFSTGNWSGYVSCYRLHADGSLELESFAYEMPEGQVKTQPVGERLSGDFWLVMRASTRLAAASTYVRFVEGRIVADRTRWRVSPEGVGTLRAIFKRPGVYTANGTAGEVFAFVSGYAHGLRTAAGGWLKKQWSSSFKAELDVLLEWFNDVVELDAPVRDYMFLLSGDNLARLRDAFPSDDELFRAVRTRLLGWPDERDSGG